MEPEKKGLHSSTIFLMIVVAALIDLIQFVTSLLLIGLFLNPFISFFAWCTFGIWFHHHGVPRWLGVSLAGVAEFFPVFGAIPFWTFYVSTAAIRSGLHRAGHKE